VAASEIPVISAVGHETDWTLIDFVADARAPTPTKAAEWAVPKHSELIARMAELRERLRYAVVRGIEGRRSDLRAAARGLPRPQDLLGLARQRFDGVSGRLGQALRAFASEKRGRLARWEGRLDIRLIAQRAERGKERLGAADREMRQVVRRLVQQRHVLLGRQAARLQPGLLRHPARRGRERLDLLSARAGQCLALALDQRRNRLEALGQLLRTLSHKSVLERGFVLVRDAEGRMLRRAAEAEAAARIELEFIDGRLPATIGASGSGAGAAHSPASPAGKPRARPSRKQKDTQGQLF
jgi:exodeoxyribonuclease VII large subunit